MATGGSFKILKRTGVGTESFRGLPSPLISGFKPLVDVSVTFTPIIVLACVVATLLSVVTAPGITVKLINTFPESPTAKNCPG